MLQRSKYLQNIVSQKNESTVNIVSFQQQTHILCCLLAAQFHTNRKLDALNTIKTIRNGMENSLSCTDTITDQWKLRVQLFVREFSNQLNRSGSAKVRYDSSYLIYSEGVIGETEYGGNSVYNNKCFFLLHSFTKPRLLSKTLCEDICVGVSRMYSMTKYLTNPFHQIH